MASPDIFAIGGGDMCGGETIELDREFVARTGKQSPRVLFIPTASGDDSGYAEGFASIYGGRLGCHTDVLYLLSDGFELDKIARADAIYVGGGNTKMMLEVWTDTGALAILDRVIREGTPVGGLSAGAICWFRVGNSDWPQYENIPDVNTARLPGMNLVDLVVCPHTRDEGFRLSEFRAMMQAESGIGVGLDDCCAIHVNGDQYRILACQESGVAHRIEWIGDQLLERILVPGRTYASLAEL